MTMHNDAEDSWLTVILDSIASIITLSLSLMGFVAICVLILLAIGTGIEFIHKLIGNWTWIIMSVSLIPWAIYRVIKRKLYKDKE